MKDRFVERDDAHLSLHEMFWRCNENGCRSGKTRMPCATETEVSNCHQETIINIFVLLRHVFHEHSGPDNAKSPVDPCEQHRAQCSKGNCRCCITRNPTAPLQK